MAGIFGINAETMEQVDALQRLRADYPTGFPMVRPHVKAPALVTDAGETTARLARFGFSRRFSSFNARQDKLASGKMWSRMFGKSHTLIPVSYVVEWAEHHEERRPYLIRRADGQPIMAPALLGGYHEDKTDSAFAICTREPNRFFAAFHNRMIGICPPALEDRWLQPQDVPHDKLMQCIAAPADEDLVAVPTSPDITKRQSGDWSPLPADAEPLTWKRIQEDAP